MATGSGNPKTVVLSKEQAQQDWGWHVVDATGIPVGRLATEVASLIRGKHKPTFSPHVDGGDFVVVINAEKVKFTGNKWNQKIYYSHSGYIGGLKERVAAKVRDTHPERIIEHAVHGMLPKGRLGRKLQSKLKVYAGAEHPHSPQKPLEYSVGL